ncbi:LysR substrate-binding domain-containing protein [Rhizobiaceae bacterium BDR2-2]|uniref:LysR substrate-binding domain-containing protein n=1 Tax=Ectorhizobium quercum TaxID=2965071 RepID=A0AAE3MYI5_9HYPH|nr:LysR substrate-binding domain-containing protein [Ectorhizobium quercum]MCX8996646.1 LysR substrate-binding domain-containing protein [Ectorhizobium quercum]
MKMSRQFPLNALRVFEATARHLSFTRAGEELGMTQTAVSYQIRLLEENVGKPLFERRPRQIALTETGERLFPRVAEAFGLLTEAVRSARRTADETLEIHSVPTFAAQWLARHLGGFQLQHPDIAVRLLRAVDEKDFDRETADVAIRIGTGNWPGLVCHPILRLRYAPMLSPELAASVGGISQLSDLLALPCISSTAACWRSWFSAAGVDASGHSFPKLDAFGALDMEANAAIAGHGVAMLSPFYVQDELDSGRLIQPFDLFLEKESIYWLVYPRSRRNTYKIKAFRQWITDMLPPFEPDGQT